MGAQLSDGQAPSFGEEAHRVLARARAAARRLRHASLGTEHLLIGCVEEVHGQAAELLYRAGISRAGVVSRVRLLGKPTSETSPEELMMTQGLRAALRVAREEAEHLRDGEVRSEHLLLAILRERSSGGAVVLRATGLDAQAMRMAVARLRLGHLARKVRAPWIARGPSGALALLGAAAIVSAAVLTLHWLFTIRPFVRSAYLIDLLIPVALLSIGLVVIGASRIEALRQAAERDSLLAAWVAQSAAARIAAALELAQSGAVDTAIPRLEAAVDREMPESDVRAALPLLARWLAAEDLAPYGYFARGLLRMHAGQTQAGLADLDTAVRSRPENTRWRGLYGVWLAKAGRDDDAYPLLRDAAADPSCDPVTALEYGTLLLRRGEVREAEVLAHVAARALPDASRPLAVLAAARFLAGSNDEPSGALNEALQADASDTLAHAVHAAVLLQKGSAHEALALVRDAAASTIERPGYLAAVEGWALADLGYEREAALAFAQAREADPGLVSTLKHMRQGLLDRQLDNPAREIGRLLTWLAA